MWMYLGLLAALFLGLHNLCKKHAVRGNEVYPVLFGTVLSGFVWIVIFFMGTKLFPDFASDNGYNFQTLRWQQHIYICIKSCIMSSSWVLAYQALKHLPITIVTPIRSAGPFFTFIGALVIYKESPNALQWIGFFLILFSVMLYSKIGKKEGIYFKNNKWIFAIIGATFLGASSGLYDKFLIQNLQLNPQTLQFWFCIYTLAILLVILGITWLPFKEKRKAFTFRWSIVAVGILLQTADYFYFKALQDPEAMIMLLSAIKRSQILIAVVIGGLVFKEKNKRKKLVPLFGILIGVFLILYTN
ncbi:DMT family transporter [Tenacibaculum sp. SG-28]|uniref:DMT family transporter n=1 Tax=Tenacibaculum sp. SG-28 TaxID=754426 RepID=UPI000CF3824A|nr:DMT family transporter [Tenacibaculum sp. SG-28]PQJ23260.1 permease [Tenacibaculum sp. SG-28]